MNKPRVENADRISQLPDDILIHILSFLRIKYSIRTSVLSKRWSDLSAISKLPCLNFGKIKCYPGVLEDDFMNFVLILLGRRSDENIYLEKFWLTLDCYSKSNVGRRLKSWSRYLIPCNIKELIFENLYPFCSIKYCKFPPSYLSVESLVVLHLSGLRFADASADVKLFSLKKLILSNVIIRDSMVRKLLKTCFALQELKLDYCRWIEYLKVTGLGDLKTLDLTRNDRIMSIEINAPSLESCCLSDNRSGCDIDFINCASLKKLNLQYMKIDDNWLSNLLSVTTQLEHLQIDAWNSDILNSVTILSNHLKFLSLENYGESFDGEISAPNLETLTFHGEGMISLNTNVSSNFKAMLEMCPYVVTDNWIIGLIILLRKLNFSKAVNLVTNIPNSKIPNNVTKYLLDSKIMDELELQDQQLGDCFNLGMMDFLRKIFPNVNFSMK